MSRWLVAVWALCAVLTAVRTAPCPAACSCRWKNGKQTVECRASGLKVVPQGLDPGTQVLDLSENDLAELPANVFRQAGLLNLQKIFLSECGLKRVDPAAFSGLTNLVYLDLADNELSELPKRSFPSIAALRELKFSGNPIQVVEADAFRSVPGLVKLDLNDCKIGEIEPAAFDPLRILESLKLRENRLQELQERSVIALGQVHNVELHANPWQCDCRLRSMKAWLQRNNIPYPVPPSCHGPPRLAGKTFEELSLDEFACTPQLLAMVREVMATADENATLTCRIGAVPRARLSWYLHGTRLDNRTRIGPGRTVSIVEEGQFERVSRLVIPGVSVDDASDDFLCVGENPAGEVRTNFTLTVSSRMLLSPLTAGQIAGIAVGVVLFILIIVLLLITLARVRSGGKHDDDKAKPPVATSNGREATIRVDAATDEDYINPVQKPPRLTELGFPPRYSTSTGSIVDSSVYVRAPDILPERHGGATAHDGTAHLYAGAAPDNPLADDSYELRHLPSTSGSDPEPRVDPSIYGYPADYGLPIPQIPAPTASLAPHELGSRSQLPNYGGSRTHLPALSPPAAAPPQLGPRNPGHALSSPSQLAQYGYGDELPDFGGSCAGLSEMSTPYQLPEFGSHLQFGSHTQLPKFDSHNRLADWPERRLSMPPPAPGAGMRPISVSSEIEMALDSSRASSNVGSTRKRPWEMGVPVLPPLPAVARVGSAAGTDV